jgi:ATP-dependent protease ClpP protease subunit
MSRAAFFLFASVFFNALVPVVAADIFAYRQGVLIQGTIQKGDYAKIIQFVRHPDNYGRFTRSVFLDSPGGDLGETIRIAHLLEKSYAATHVGSGARCYSACFILWMSGVSRNVFAGAALGVHRISVKVDGESMDPASERYASIARRVEDYMGSLGTPRTILDKMNATASASMFVISQRWLAEQRLLTAVSYRGGFIDAVQAQCGPEPYAAALKDSAPMSEAEAQRWVEVVKRWIGCADELRASSQKLDGVSIAALIDASDTRR